MLIKNIGYIMVYFSVINFYKNDRGVFENGQKKCPKLKNQKKFLKKPLFTSIVIIMLLFTEKIIIKMLR